MEDIIKEIEFNNEKNILINKIDNKNKFKNTTKRT